MMFSLRDRENMLSETISSLEHSAKTLSYPIFFLFFPLCSWRQGLIELPELNMISVYKKAGLELVLLLLQPPDYLR